MICPVCVANAAAVVVGAGTAGGGFSAVAWRILRWRKGPTLTKRGPFGVAQDKWGTRKFNGRG
jgi:hypothetical protein